MNISVKYTFEHVWLFLCLTHISISQFLPRQNIMQVEYETDTYSVSRSIKFNVYILASDLNS